MKSSWTQWEEAKRARSSPLPYSQVFPSSLNYSDTLIIYTCAETSILTYPRKMSFGVSFLTASFVTVLWFDRNMDDSVRNDAHHLPCDECHLSPCAFRLSSGRLPAISLKWNEILLMQSMIDRDAHLPLYLNSTTWRRQAASALSKICLVQ